MTSTRLIKRYANRKLYDTSESRYVKLEEIADMVDRGEEVKIIDNETKEDITRISLAQILVRRGRKGSLGDSMTSLRDLVVKTGEQISKRISDPVTTLKTSVEDSVQKLLKTGEERAEKGRDQFRSWVAQNTLAIEDIQRRFDERVRIAIGRLDLWVRCRSSRTSRGLEKKLSENHPLFGLMTSVSLEVDPQVHGV